jgi:ABC-type antimicrobial peptide transport system permease subunit
MPITSLKSTLRTFKRNKGFTILNIAGLAVGLTSCLLLLLYVDYEWQFDKQFRDYENIYVVYSNQSGGDKIFSFPVSSAPMAAAAQAEVPGVTAAVRVTDAQDQLLAYNERLLKKPGMYADSAFFGLFDYPFLQGSPSTALQNSHSVVLTHSMARALFGKEDPMNKIIRLNNKDNLVVTGVIKDIPANETNQFDYIIPWSLYQQNNVWLNQSGWSANVCMTYVRLRDRQAFPAADALFRNMLKTHNNDNSTQAFLYPLSRYHLYDTFANGKPVGGRIRQVTLLSILAFSILLIAGINYMNLSTARSHGRAKEIAIRKTIGSSRGVLVRQFLTESLLFAVCASLLAVVALTFCLPWFNNALGLSLASPLHRPLFWIGLVILALLTGLLSGSYPSLYLSSFQPLKVLKGNLCNRSSSAGKGALRFREILVTVQFVLAIVLIISTFVIYSQISYIRNRPIGFDKNNLLEIPLQGALARQTTVLKNELLKSGIATAACNFSQSLTNIYYSGWDVDWPGKNARQKVLFDYYGSGYDFSKTTALSIIQGRDFSVDFPSDSTGILLSETAAQAMGLKNPVGTQIRLQNQPMTVVGVFKDFVSGSPYSQQRPMLTYLDPAGGSVMALRLNPGRNLATTVQQLNALLKQLNPGYPPDIHFVDQQFEEKFKNEQQLRTLSNLFGTLAIFISCLGLLGLSAFAAEQRVKEIGIRKILGASVPGIIHLLSADYMRLVGLAALIAFPIAWIAMRQWLRNYEYHVQLQWWIFAAAGMLTAIVALFTVSILSFKAAVSNPVKNLRTE